MITKDNAKRKINFRPLLWLFVFGMIATYCTANIFLGHIWLFICFSVLFAIVLTLCIISFFKQNFLISVRIFFGIKNLKALCLSLLVVMITFSGLTAINWKLYSERQFANTMHSIKATVRKIEYGEEEQDVLLGDVIVDGTRQNFNITASCAYDVISLKLGDNVDFVVNLYPNKLVRNGEIATYPLKDNIQYFCTIESGVVATSGKAHWDDYIRDRVKNIFIESLDKDTAGICYAVIMGDKALLSTEYYNIFKSAGVAHILAVSGLHVGFFVAITLFLLKLLKIKKHIRFWIVACVLLFMNILCGFAPSVLRASIMSLCLSFGLLIGERNDSLSNLSFAGIIVLLLQPFNLFDVGFLLSFASVFGILFFQKPISKLLIKIHIPKIISDPIAMTLSATIGTLPFVCKYFGEIAPISILSNLVVLPMFTLAYYILIPSTLLALVFGSNVMFLSNFSMNSVVMTSSFFAKLGMIKLFDFDDFSSMFYFLILFFISPYFMLDIKKKAICALTMLVALSPILIIVNSETKFTYDSISVCYRATDTCFLTTKDNQKVLINVGKNSSGFYNTRTMLKKNKVKNIDILLLMNIDEKDYQNIKSLPEYVNVYNIVVIGDISPESKNLIENVYQNSDIDYQLDESFELRQNIKVYVYSESEKCKAINLQFDETNFLFIQSAVSYENINSNAIFSQTFDVVVTNSITDDRYRSLETDSLVTFNSTVGNNYFSLVDDLWTIKF